MNGEAPKRRRNARFSRYLSEQFVAHADGRMVRSALSHFRAEHGLDPNAPVTVWLSDGTRVHGEIVKLWETATPTERLHIIASLDHQGPANDSSLGIFMSAPGEPH